MQAIDACQEKPSVTWIVVHDSRDLPTCESLPWNENLSVHMTTAPGGISGNHQRNIALDFMQISEIENTGWVWFLDDDNEMHPEFITSLMLAINNTVVETGFIFHQQKSADPQDIRPGLPENVRVGYIDQAQYCLHSSFFRTERFVQQYEADGILIEKLYHRDPSFFHFIDKVLCYYNSINWRAE